MGWLRRLVRPVGRFGKHGLNGCLSQHMLIKLERVGSQPGEVGNDERDLPRCWLHRRLDRGVGKLQVNVFARSPLCQSLLDARNACGKVLGMDGSSNEHYPSNAR